MLNFHAHRRGDEETVVFLERDLIVPKSDGKTEHKAAMR
jgi:hypothetical protein